tara:strand:+ start:1014 stop:1205 length:192 start_codon:yes stop_codon:yes gene_type:complete
MEKVKIKFIKEYLTHKGEMYTTSLNAKNLIDKGVAELVEETEKPKRGRKPKNKEELKDSIETK